MCVRAGTRPSARASARAAGGGAVRGCTNSHALRRNCGAHAPPAAMFARLALAALAAATTATAQVFLPDGYVHADHQNEHLEGSLFFGPGAIAQAGGPEQLSLAFGATPDAMTVTWLTSDTSAQTVVRYGTASGKLTQAATGAPGAAYSCGGYTSGAIHLVTLTGLAPATKYYYEVGPVGAASAEASFTSSPGVGPLFPYAFGVIGDLGQTANSASTVAHVIASGANSTFITGDLSYADSDQPRWDSYQRLVQNLSSNMPFMVASGNHEIEACLPNVYQAYAARYASMPSKGSPDGPLYYSYEVGPAHVMILASFFAFDASSAQYKWIQSDLAAIDRAKTPWVIVLIHAPWYNSNTAHTNDGQQMRQTIEPLLHAAKINAVFAGHVHAMERSHLAYNLQPDPTGAMHVTIGDGGNREGLYVKWVSPIPAYSAFHASEYGSGLLRLVNATTAIWEWHVNSDDESKIADSFVLNNIAV